MGTWDISSYLGHVEDIWGVHRIFGGGLSRGGLSRLFDHIFTHSFRRLSQGNEDCPGNSSRMPCQRGCVARQAGKALRQSRGQARLVGGRVA